MSDSPVIYGDGSLTVTVEDGGVAFATEDSTLLISRATMREIVIGWDRQLSQEREG